jgi:hypothetical protein
VMFELTQITENSDDHYTKSDGRNVSHRTLYDGKRTQDIGKIEHSTITVVSAITMS